MIAIIERLAAAGFEPVPMAGRERHVVLVREQFAAVLERTESGFRAAGAAGMITERGLAMLVWRGEQAFFVLKNYEESATAEQVAGLRRFADDLAGCLGQP